MFKDVASKKLVKIARSETSCIVVKTRAKEPAVCKNTVMADNWPVEEFTQLL